MRCHYEVLQVARDVDAAGLKRAFRQLALQWHPDKHQRNNVTLEEATTQFQELQNAYQVLTDPHERKWYDDHRDQILRSGSGGGGGLGEEDDGEDDLNLFPFFSTSVYTGFGDDERGFYSVYDAIFAKIDGLDAPTQAAKGEDVPRFGRAETSSDETVAFYQHWQSYVTRRTFAWVDEYRTVDAPSRQIRRAMEKENKKLRDAAKKEFVALVRELAEFVKKRDPRMRAYQQQREKEKREQALAEEQRRREKQAAYEAERLAFKEQERERWAASETSRFADDHIEAELEKLRKKLDGDVMLCDLCSKTFRSAKQLQNHLVSKKHREREQELGIMSDSTFGILEDDIDAQLRAEAEAEHGTAEAASGVDATPEVVLDDVDESQLEPKPSEHDCQVEELAKAENERLRLEKELKAADKRKERKDKRKEKKKTQVEQIVSAAKEKSSKDSSASNGKEQRRGRKKKA